MKRLLQTALLAAVGLCLAGAGLAYEPPVNGYTPGAGILGTPHDLATAHHGMGYENPADPLDRVCIYCHAPHNTYKLSPANNGPGAGIGAGPMAPDDYTYLPLWNHTVTVEAFTMYQNGPGAPTVGPKASQAIDQNPLGPGPSSLLCLSCHDGSVAVNAYGNSAQLAHSRGPIDGGRIGVVYQIGKDGYLGNHHPIAFNYDAVAAVDGDIVSADVASFGAAGAVRNHLYGAGNDQMECGSCHSVHNKGNGGETLLWTTDTASGLCLTCHDK